MRRPSSHLITSFLIFVTTLLFAVSDSFAQKETGVFKFIPKYYPEGQFVDAPPPEVVNRPKVVFPDDPRLQGEEAMVWVKVKVDRQGIVRDAQVLKSTDERFNGYATHYAKEYRFRWPEGLPQKAKDAKFIWVSVPITFTQW